jgi:hypothetical protein
VNSIATRVARIEMKLFCLRLAVVCSLSFATAQAHAAIELVVNGGFEETADEPTDFIPEWDEFGLTMFHGVGGNPRTGAQAAFFGAIDGTSEISQSLPTTAGTIYSLTFWLANSADADPPDENFFAVRWEGGVVATGTNVNEFGYTLFTSTVTASSDGSLLEFEFQNDAEFFDLDDVSVTEVNPIPEPASLTLWSLGALAFGLASRRRLATAR